MASSPAYYTLESPCKRPGGLRSRFLTGQAKAAMTMAVALALAGPAAPAQAKRGSKPLQEKVRPAATRIASRALISGAVLALATVGTHQYNAWRAEDQLRPALRHFLEQLHCAPNRAAGNAVTTLRAFGPGARRPDFEARRRLLRLPHSKRPLSEVVIAQRPPLRIGVYVTPAGLNTGAFAVEVPSPAAVAAWELLASAAAGGSTVAPRVVQMRELNPSERRQLAKVEASIDRYAARPAPAAAAGAQRAAKQLLDLGTPAGYLQAFGRSLVRPVVNVAVQPAWLTSSCRISYDI